MRTFHLPLVALLMTALLTPPAQGGVPSAGGSAGKPEQALPAAEPAATAKPEQNALRISGDGPIKDYTIVTLTQPSRLVIEIEHTVPGLRLEPLPADRLGIGSIQIEESADSVRIILKAAQGGVLPYRIERDGGGLQVILSPPEQEK